MADFSTWDRRTLEQFAQEATDKLVAMAGWQQWVYEVTEYLDGCIETPGKFESMGSIDARRLLAAAPKHKETE